MGERTGKSNRHRLQQQPWDVRHLWGRALLGVKAHLTKSEERSAVGKVLLQPQRSGRDGGYAENRHITSAANMAEIVAHVAGV